MSSPFKNRFKNFFLSKSISRETMKQLVGDHLDALEAPNQPAGAPDTAALAAALRPLYEQFGTGLGGGAAAQSQRQGATTTQDAAFEALKAYPADAARQFILPKFKEKTAEYEEFFPQGRTAFSNATRKNVGTRMRAFITTALKYKAQVGAEVATKSQALLTAFEAAGTVQGKAIKALKDGSKAVQADQRVLATHLFANYGTLLSAFAATPEQAATYFDFSGLPGSQKKPDQAA